MSFTKENATLTCVILVLQTFNIAHLQIMFLVLSFIIGQFIVSLKVFTQYWNDWTQFGMLYFCETIYAGVALSWIIKLYTFIITEPILDWWISNEVISARFTGAFKNSCCNNCLIQWKSVISGLRPLNWTSIDWNKNKRNQWTP